MASLIEELIDTLKEQYNVYESLLDIASKKKVIIVENNIQILQQFIKEENLLISKSQKLEKKRIEIFNDISTVLGKNNDLSLKNVIEAMKGQKGEKELTEIRTKMLDILEKLKFLNDQNQKLIEISMDYIDFSINVVRSSSAPTYYDSLGNEINASDRKMFDAKQ